MTTRGIIAAVLLAAVITSGACYDPDRTVGPDEVLLLTASPEAIPANGFSTSRITAKITPSSNRGATVSFVTSGGTLSSTAPRGRMATAKRPCF